MRAALVLLALAVSASASAQVDPRPIGPDGRIQAFDYVPDQVFRIQAAQGYQVTLQLGPDERIENAAVGDSTAWHPVTVSDVRKAGPVRRAWLRLVTATPLKLLSSLGGWVQALQVRT